MNRKHSILLFALIWSCGNADSKSPNGDTDGPSCVQSQTAQEDATRALDQTCTTDQDCDLYEDSLICGCLLLAASGEDVSAVATATADVETACAFDCEDVTCGHGTVDAPRTAFCDGGTCNSRQ